MNQGVSIDSSAQELESTIWEIKRNDLPRAYNRSLVDNLFNGAPPFSDQHVKQNNISVNLNDLAATKISQDAQGQFTTAIFSPSQFFSVKVDRGPKHKRDEWSEVITTKLRRAMRNGQSAGSYRENMRSIFGQLVLHGIGPMQWPDRECWRPEMQAVGDVMIPSRTLLTMDGLPYWATYRRYTANQLYRMTHGPKVDPGWDVKVADKCIAWAAKQYGQTTSGTDLIWSPERVEQDIKAGSVLYMSDAVPTINVWDCRIYSDEKKDSGWKRKIILDAPSINEAGFSASKGLENVPTAGSAKNILDSRNQFLYNSRKRNYASKLSEMVHFQFANGSVVAPFRYDTIRSLGWLLYTPCQLQNRLRSAYTKAAFEACSQYFRTDNPDDAQRVLKLDLIDECVIPNGINFVGAQERWKTDSGLINDVLAQNRQTIADNSTAYTKNFGNEDRKQGEKTATQITAEVNAASALVGSMLEQFYGYENFKNREICRRFCIPNSKDPDVRWFRNECLKAGVPEDVLDVDCWDIAEERVMGNGNTQLAIAQAQMIMQFYSLLDPNAQRVALRTYMFAVTRDASKTDQLAPEEPLLTTRSVHDAQVSVATLLAAQPMGLIEGVSHAEYAATLIGALSLEVQKIEQSGGVPKPEQMAGLMNLAGQSIDGQPIEGNGAANHIAILAQDKGSKELVKQLGDLLGKQMNLLKAFAQRLEEQAQAAAQNGNGNGQPPIDAKTAAALKGKILMDEVKAENQRENSTQRRTQKDEIHQQRMQQDQDKVNFENAKRLRDVDVGEKALDLKTAAEISREALKPAAPKPTPE